MVSFQALMQLSQSKTEEAEATVQQALMDRKRKEKERLKAQAEQERKDKELADKLRLQHFEKLKKEKEEAEKKERERRAKQAEQQRREDEQRDALRYGPKKAKSIASSSSGSPKWPQKTGRSYGSDDGGDDDDASQALTREELRERKHQAALRRTMTTSRRSTRTGGYMKPGARLPGGAVDIVSTSAAPSANSNLSIKERLAAAPMGLQKLNLVKKDRRTIDEIQRDIKARKAPAVIQGDAAREFNDWFTSKKKPDVPAKKVATSSNTPSRSSTPVKSFASAPVSTNTGYDYVKAKSAPAVSSKTATTSRPSAASTKPLASRPSSERPMTKVSSRPLSSSRSSQSSNSSAAPLRKRPRSPDSSVSPPPAKRRAHSPVASSNLKAEIWKLFGKDRTQYVSRDDFSDDEDMEADATALEREEAKSARIARKEDEEAALALKRAEDEKRRRKMMRA